MISGMIPLLFFIFILAVGHDFYLALFRLLQSLVFTILLSFGNLMLLSFFVTETENREMKIGSYFYLFSYSFAILDFLLVKYLHTLVTGLKWEGSENYLSAYALAVIAVSVINLFIITMQQVVFLQHAKSKSQIENLQLKGNVSDMANLLLRQQIQPHFLFNALSMIKSLYKKDPAQAEDYLVHLVNFLRVSVSNRDTKTTTVRNELDFCLDYLTMQKLRFGEAFNYKVEISEQTLNNGYLPYFSLQSLAENALKHNDLTVESPIDLFIKEEAGYLIVENNIRVPRYKEISTGQGLANLSERYRLLGAEDIIISSDGIYFNVKIKLLEK